MTASLCSRAIAAAVTAITVSASPAMAQAAAKAVFVPAPQVAWASAGMPGVHTAAVRGNMKTGPSHFYLKYAAGFVAPVHHHSPDHYGTTVSGNLVLIVDGKEHVLPPGSHFSFTGKARHAVRCRRMCPRWCCPTPGTTLTKPYKHAPLA